MDTKGKQRFRDIVKNSPLWDKAADAMSKVLFPNAINPSIGIAIHARFILWALVNFSNVLIKLPRRHGKSTYVTFLYVMWCILTRRKNFILIVSSTGNQAVKFLMRIKHYLTSYKVKQYYGDLAASSAVVDTENESFEYIEANGKKRSQIWNFKEIYIEVWNIRIMATSISSANRGLLSVDDRPDLIILDDIEDKKNTNTPELRQRLAETVYEEIIPAGAIGCQFVVVGTICHYGSLLLKLQQSSNWFVVPLDRATMPIKDIEAINNILPEEFPEEYKFKPRKEYFTRDIVDLDGVSRKRGEETPEVAIWQEQYNYEFFCKEFEDYSSVGLESSFWQEYYNIPKSKHHQVFKNFQFIKDVEPVEYYGDLVLKSNGNFVFEDGKKVTKVFAFIGGDLAVSEKTNADWRSFFIVFTDHWGNVYALPPERNKEPDPFIIAKWVLKQHSKYKFISGTFDGQHFQKWFGKILKYLYSESKAYKRLKVFQESRSEKKEQVIISTLSPLINSGRLYFIGNENQFENVVKELRRLGYNDTDDDADALTYACSNLKYPPYVDYDMVNPYVNNSKVYDWTEGLSLDEVAWLA